MEVGNNGQRSCNLIGDVYIVKALGNEGTLLRTHCCRHKCFLPARATFVADTNFVSGTQKMFSSLRSPRNIMGNNVSGLGKREHIVADTFFVSFLECVLLDGIGDAISYIPYSDNCKMDKSTSIITRIKEGFSKNGSFPSLLITLVS